MGAPGEVGFLVQGPRAVMHAWSILRARGFVGVLSRRSFIRRSGLVLLAVGPAPALTGCHVRRLVDDPAFARAAILGDSALCVGCRRCELSCSALHHDGLVWPEMARLTVDARIEERKFIDGLWFADACHQCPWTLGEGGGEDPPPCIAVCPTGALHVASSVGGRPSDLRLRVIDEALCNGCAECLDACPYSVPKMDVSTDRAVLCDLCIGRIIPGQEQSWTPTCVRACPSTALRYYEPWRHMPERPFPFEPSS